MKVFYTGVYRDQTGYGEAARNYIHALYEAGCEVACRPLRLGSSPPASVSPLIEALEKNRLGYPDVFVQHSLPWHFSYDAACGLNVGIFSSETDRFVYSGWQRRLDLMDLVIVSGQQSRQACLSSGTRKPIEVVPYCTDTSRFTRHIDPHPVTKEYKRDFKTLFYTIGQFNPRKNLGGLLRAYWGEFGPAEPVALLVKTDGDLAGCEGFAEEIRRGLGLARVAEVRFLCEAYSPDELDALHVGCDVFVGASHGESWGIPAFDAMGFGKTPVITAGTGYGEYVDDTVGWSVESVEVPVFGACRPELPGLYHGSELWKVPCVTKLRACLREAISSPTLRLRKAEEGVMRALSYGHKRVGNRLREVFANYGQEMANSPSS